MDIIVENLVQVWDDGGDGVRALDGISHHFRSGTLTCLLGPSGCGKSTLAQIVGGIETATSGAIRIVDPSNPAVPPAKPGRCSVMMWQSLNLFPWRNVIDNVAFGLEMAGVPREARYARARELIGMVGLRNFEEKACSQLSGGMRQRVALARALIMDRPILLMDEPFAALDAQTKIVMQEELTRIFERMRKTILFVTHAIDEAILLGDEVVVMTARPGRIKEVIAIDLPRPRTQEMVGTKAFGELYDRILHLIREEVLNAMRQQDEAVL
ncbi:ABC transporter ATP-binding protein [Rhodoplanes sp. TEM]|uniref:ABC transporter ATP-binding protein n=1 Tax=Rhodoplanes tepidamans TaxID=200616 RepID=A0ABT5JGQ5_RHOTP|nr:MULTISPECIES: ABC transporter ATP-binding protein [Rhodoplanes]MDC7788893.1 ABC transporter ATP-binding protein [Rhodoplanes tepidamans]MDC7985600.1 ABC transporter ATP-binding protein [Rhodoplanes sp. TEM]MDQ0358773.1 NitT/TauT family transport system ATP-binding protein [Rhodoplanes tepidamans]